MQRMAVTEALRVTETEENYDIDATMHGGGISGQAGALRMAIARSLVELDPESTRCAEEGRPARPATHVARRARSTASRRPARPRSTPSADRSSAVGQLRFGTDGVRGRALTELTTDYVASLGRAAAEVLGAGDWLIGRDTRESGAKTRSRVRPMAWLRWRGDTQAGVIADTAVGLPSALRRACQPR